MRWKAAVLGLAGISLVLLLGDGCTGPGVPTEQIRGESLQEVATDHLSAVILVKSWFQVLHQREAGTSAASSYGAALVGPAASLHGARADALPGTAWPRNGCMPDWDMEFMPDGSIHFWGTTSDCQTFDYVQALDGSGSGSLTWPDGGTDTMTWSAPVWNGLKYTVHLQETLRSGVQLEYDHFIDFGLPETPQTKDGSAILPDGQAMTFVFHRSFEGEDDLTLELPDGSKLTVKVPLTALLDAAYWPVFSEGAQGTFTAASGAQQSFTITGDGDCWDTWQCASPDGMDGSFTLGEGFDGTGQLQQDGSVIGALRWEPTGSGTLDMVAAESVELTPSAAARDFQIDQWISSIAAMGPAPMY